MRSGWRCAMRTLISSRREGECFHNATVTGGKPASEGPLALKRDLRETEGTAGDRLGTALAQAEDEADALTRDDRES